LPFLRIAIGRLEGLISARSDLMECRSLRIALEDDKVCSILFRPTSRRLAALYADPQLKKARSSPRLLRALASGGNRTLRLVTCRSSDPLRLSSSGRTGRQSPFESGRSPSCCLRPSCDKRAFDHMSTYVGSKMTLQDA
jgi:hypothetical protein